MFKAIHAPNFKEFQVETLLENHVIFHKLYNEEDTSWKRTYNAA